MSVARGRTAAILVGGAAGALLRAAVSRTLTHDPGAWPWATFAVNLAGTVILAWLTVRLAEMVAPTRYWRFLIGTGFCGALTTFSTFQVETITLAREGHPVTAVGYVVAALTAGIATAAAAAVLARRRRYG